MQVLKPLYRVMVALFLVLVANAAHAYCVPGQDSSNPGCVGTGSDNERWEQERINRQNRRQSAPALRWYNSFGAVAFDSIRSTYGYSSSQGSKSLADRNAKNDCGLSTCKTEFTYSNQCAAMSFGQKGRGGWHTIEVSTDKSEAESKALDVCVNSGVKNCKIIMSECSLPYQAY